MTKVKVFVETKNIGDAIFDKLNDMISANDLLSRLVQLKKLTPDLKTVLENNINS